MVSLWYFTVIITTPTFRTQQQCNTHSLNNQRITVTIIRTEVVKDQNDQKTQWLRYRLDGTVEFELQYRPMYMYWFTYENP